MVNVRANFADQVVVAPAAAQGLGFAIARKFAEASAVVFMTDLQADKLEAAAAALSGSRGRVHGVAIDCADQASLRRLRAAIEELADGRLDVLINNAGGWR